MTKPNRIEGAIKGFFTDKKVLWALTAALITSVAAYGYGLTNSIYNYDGVYNMPALGVGGEVSGRWMLRVLLQLAKSLGVNYSLPYFDLLFSLTVIALSAVLLCGALGLSRRRSYALIGMTTLAFPAVASMTFFSFTMPYYALAFFWIALGYWLTERSGKLPRFGLLALLLALAMGVYQAFYPFAVMFAVLITVSACLDPAAKPLAVLRKGLRYVAAILLSYVLYRLFLKLTLSLLDTKLRAYQGIDQMGIIDLKTLPDVLRQMYRHFFLLFDHDYLSLTGTWISRLCVLLLLVLSGALLALGWREKNPWKRVELGVLLLLALPVASNLIILMVPYGTVYTLMGMGLLSLFYLPVLLWDRLAFPRPEPKQVLGLLLAGVLLLSSFHYVHLTNGCYQVLEWSNKQAENYYLTLFTRVKSLPGYDETYPVVFSGDVIDDASYRNIWLGTFQYGGMLQFDTNDPKGNTFNEFSRKRFVLNYLGYTFREISAAERTRYAQVLAEMNTYPNDDSIRIVEGLVLIKFQ